RPAAASSASPRGPTILKPGRGATNQAKAVSGRTMARARSMGAHDSGPREVCKARPRPGAPFGRRSARGGDAGPPARPAGPETSLKLLPDKPLSHLNLPRPQG